MDVNILKTSKEELLSNKKVSINIYDNNEFAFFNMALMMTEEIKKNNEQGKHTLFICPVGPVGQYKYFVKMVNSEKISLKDVWFINMDEYMLDSTTLIDKEHPFSFRGFMDKEVYTKISPDLVMPENQRIFPTPGKEKEIPEIIEKLGGVDICFGGIGINGHLAFNEPPEENENISDEEYKNLSVRVLKIARETKTVNSLDLMNGGFAYMPEYCVTIGIKEILGAKKIRLFCFRDWHRPVVRQAVYLNPTAKFPVSFIQNHKDATIGITENVAAPAF